MFNEFRKFVLRCNVVDLAVGIVIGAAFTTLVQAFVRDFINPLLSLFGGGQVFSTWEFNIGNAEFKYGDFINNALSFLIVAAVVFFFVVKPINHLTERFKASKDTPEAATRKCPLCLGEVPKAAKRCQFCTAAIKPEKA